jgi:hypothetical protein
VAGLQPGGRPVELVAGVNVIAWVLSNEASFVSGEIMPVDAAPS